MKVIRFYIHQMLPVFMAVCLFGQIQAFAAASRGGVLGVPLPLFPSNNWWNVDISQAPVASNSSSYISFINNGGTRRMHPDFGGYEDPVAQTIYGFPYVVVNGNSQVKKAVQFDYSDESDGVNHSTGQSFAFYPIPGEAITQSCWIEGGQPGNVKVDEDRHMLIVDQDNNYLYELYYLYWNGTQWTAGSGAFFDMNTNTRRPEGWTSADAAGLAILPGLVRYDEVYGPDPIRHALRVTVRSSNGYVYPASHSAGSTANALPMGARLRLKASVDITKITADVTVRKIFQAMKTYGLIVADNGSDLYVSGTFDTRWNNDILNPAFSAVTANDFEIIQLGWALPCSSSIAPTSQTIAATGGAGSTLVTTSQGCAWTASSNAAWITLTSGQSGTGNGTLTFTVAANSGPARSGTITVAGQTFTVNQSGNAVVFNLDAGWNWISFNVLPSDRTLNSLFSGILSQIEQVKSQTQSAIYSNGQWRGDLANLEGISQGMMYKIKVTQPCTLTIIGPSIAANQPIALSTGWNWVAFLPQTTRSLSSALGSITEQVIQIKSQSQSAAYSNGQWSGSLIQLEPGKGYCLQLNAPATLTYPGQ
jgi:hypothetical protein